MEKKKNGRVRKLAQRVRALLLLHRTQLQSPAPTWLTTSLYHSSRGSDTLFWPHRHGAHTYMKVKHTLNNSLTKNNPFTNILFLAFFFFCRNTSLAGIRSNSCKLLSHPNMYPGTVWFSASALGTSQSPINQGPVIQCPLLVFTDTCTYMWNINTCRHTHTCIINKAILSEKWCIQIVFVRN